MYVFWFNSKNGQDNTLYCSKVIKTRKDEHGLHLEVDPEGGIPKMPSRTTVDGLVWFFLPFEEGEVRNRCFWLEEEDYNRAIDIQTDYLKRQWLRAKEQMERLEKKYKFKEKEDK